MHILVLTGYYAPDGGPAAPLFTMLCEALVRRGHQVTALTAVPHYPTGRVPESFRSSGTRSTIENGVRVVRVPLHSVDRSRLGSRLFQFISYQINSVFAGFNFNYDVFIAHSPALEMWLPFLWHSKLRNKPGVYSVHDVYPSVGVRLGIFRNGAVIKSVTALEKSCLHGAAKIRVLSRSFIDQLVELDVPRSKIELIYDWADVSLIKPLSKINSFSMENGLTEKFVVLYAGNLGLVQGLSSVVDTARLLVNEKDIEFVFVGDGAGKRDLIEKATHLGLKNVRFLPYQPRERMPEILASGDISLVTLQKGTGFGALPSKIYSILASSRPVIASVDPGSDAWDLVERSRSGLCIPPESPDTLARGILQLKKDENLRDEFSSNGREYVLNFHTPDYAATRFEALLFAAVESKKNQNGSI